jgi:hypothetical protein
MGTTTIEIARYPNLRLLAWQLHREHIGEAEAFAIYEREWRHLDLEHMEPAERRLIRNLAQKYGHGVLNV